ncbi:MAG: hypothetical protein ACLU99_14055 [Alphaproteobacteria bacterium]
MTGEKIRWLEITQRKLLAYEVLIFLHFRVILAANAPIRYILNKNSSKILSTGDLVVEISGGSPIQSTGRIGYVNQHTLARFDNDIITSNFCKALFIKQ